MSKTKPKTPFHRHLIKEGPNEYSRGGVWFKRKAENAKSLPIRKRNAPAPASCAPRISAQSFPLGRIVVRDPSLRGYVYIITHPMYEGWSKIGSTVDLNKRLSTYQTGDPLRRYEVAFHAEVDDRVALERWVRHRLSEKFPIHGEWVNCPTEVAVPLATEALGLAGALNT